MGGVCTWGQPLGDARAIRLLVGWFPGCVGGAAVGADVLELCVFCGLVFCCYTERFHRLVILRLSFSIKCMLGLVDNDLYQVLVVVVWPRLKGGRSARCAPLTGSELGSVPSARPKPGSLEGGGDIGVMLLTGCPGGEEC